MGFAVSFPPIRVPSLNVANAAQGAHAAAINGTVKFTTELVSSSTAFRFGINDTHQWQVNSGGSLVASVDDITDFGALGASRPRNGYFSRLLSNLGGRVVGVRVVTAAGAVTVAATDRVVVINKTVGVATAANLPATPTTGQHLIIKDGKGDAAANNITVSPAAGNIDGAATLIMNANYQAVTLVYNGAEWNVI